MHPQHLPSVATRAPHDLRPAQAVALRVRAVAADVYNLGMARVCRRCGARDTVPTR